jgi:hypothetical protein
MITNAVMSALASVVAAILGALPAVPVPSWLSGASDSFGKVFAFADSMSVWFPVPLALTVLAALMTIKLTAFGIKVLRIGISHVTGGGGSAA